jgi:mono/diheme cytochrome c family protein
MMNMRFLKFFNLVAIFSFFAINGIQAEVSPDAGKTLFKNYCAQCHAKNMKSALTGPALGGAEANWEQADLYAWIRNSTAMIEAGHPRAVELWNQYKPTVMTAFPDLTDDEIASILAYIDGVYTSTYGAAKVIAAEDTGSTKEDKASNTWVYWGLAGFLALLTILLARIINNLDVMAAAKEGKVLHQKSVWEILTSKGLVTLLVFALVILGGYTTINKAIDLGRQQDYAPDQPIKFSHATHAGLHKIDCQYCHDSARRSKHSGIPGANTCMNCHRAITAGSQYGTAEITKIYASIGFDPSTNKYIENYEEKSREDIKQIYTKWIADKYIEMNELADIDPEGEKVVAEQWDGIVSSLTNEQKDKIAGPIEWVRIHNLPDHAYFNHAQHVSVGQVECQTCHGPVETMEVVKQHSPLSMGWCVNCHRQTEVKFSQNDYYKSYAKFHEEIENGEREKVTVSDIGGLECQKCHY